MEKKHFYEFEAIMKRMEEETNDTGRNVIHINTIQRLLRDTPTIEAVPVVHGYDRWKEHKEHCEFWCSVCGYWLREIHEGDAKDNTFNFCPNCGADMRGGKNEFD